MKTKNIIVIVVLFLMIAGLGYFYIYKKNIKVFDINSVCFEDKCWDVEVVDTPETRQRGLMFRESLDRNSGMLFVFEEPGIYGFWMKNTLIPLDIIWINSDKKVVYIANAIPCSTEECLTYESEKDALYVLEINSGVAGEIGLMVGSEIKFK